MARKLQGSLPSSNFALSLRTRLAPRMQWSTAIKTEAIYPSSFLNRGWYRLRGVLLLLTDFKVTSIELAFKYYFRYLFIPFHHAYIYIRIWPTNNLSFQKKPFERRKLNLPFQADRTLVKWVSGHIRSLLVFPETIILNLYLKPPKY